MTLKLRAGVFTADTEDGIALLDEDSGRYWKLNPTGALVLRTLLAGGTPAQAARELMQHYAVDIDNAGQDVAELVTELRSAGLVEHQDDSHRVAASRQTGRTP